MMPLKFVFIPLLIISQFDQIFQPYLALLEQKTAENRRKLTIQAGFSDLEVGFFTNKMSIPFGTSQELTL